MTPSLMRRRQLIGLLLILTFAGGLWWNATRLNETERKLVGVWERVDAPSGEKAAFALLPNRTEVSFSVANGKWTSELQGWRWKATPDTFSIRVRMPVPGLSWSDWQSYAMKAWYAKNVADAPLVLLPDGTFALGPQEQGDYQLTCRSTDPELLRIFDRLSAGESP